MLIKLWLICIFGSLLYLCTTTAIDPCDESVIQLNVESCSESDFNEAGSSCTSSCTTTFNDTNIIFCNVDWIYYVSEPSSNVTLIDDEPDTNETGMTTVTLKLSEYYSGYYSCQLLYSINNIPCVISDDFKISDSAGVQNGDPCQKSSDCLNFDAYCTGTDPAKTCNCGDCNIANSVDACFCASSPNSTCYISEQCVDENYFCSSDSKCRCNGTELHFNGTAEIKCFIPVTPGQHCTYNEDCWAFDSHTNCINGYCTCNSEYSDGLDDDNHCKKPRELTDADIAAIAVAGVFALGIIAIVIRCVAEACCCDGKSKKDIEADD